MRTFKSKKSFRKLSVLLIKKARMIRMTQTAVCKEHVALVASATMVSMSTNQDLQTKKRIVTWNGK
jgi:hypothetical protein